MFGKNEKSCKGFSLLESLIAISIIGVIAAMTLSFIKTTANITITARQQTYSSRLAARVFKTLEGIPYFYVFDIDSSMPSFGLDASFGSAAAQASPYPYIENLRSLTKELNKYNFEKWTVSVEYMIRDRSDLNGDGYITDLRAFVDENSDNIDDYDNELKFYDQNSDGDYYDFYGYPEISESPNTHIKKAIFKIYKDNKVIFTESNLISREKLSGLPGKASGGRLKLLIKEPSQNSYIYALDTSQQQNAFNLSISKSYPDNIETFRADSSYTLNINGESDPVADITFYLGCATSTINDSTEADITGDFDFYPWNISTNLSEGENILYAQAIKDTNYSPWNERTILYDIVPPQITEASPSGTINSRQPSISAYLTDVPDSPGNKVSDICKDIISLFIDGEEVNFEFNSTTGFIEAIESSTDLPPVLSTGTHTVVLEGGDMAGYKAKSIWTFTCSISDPDSSAPSVALKTPSGTSSENPPEISCKVIDNQSGIDIASIIMLIDGEKIIDSSNIYSHYAPVDTFNGGFVKYTPSEPLSYGEHTVYIEVSHWADTPFDKKTTTDTWSFTQK